MTEKQYLDVGYPFEAGHQYRVVIYLYGLGGGAFSSDTAGTVNGKAATCKIVNQELKLTYTFPKLSEVAKPSITTQPKNTTVYVGKKAIFKVVASGATSYQWQYQKKGESTWHNVSVNGTSATYSLTTATRHNGYQYRCRVKNEQGTVTSSAATLTVSEKPVIRTQPANTSVSAGASVTFKVVADGAVSYQWQYKKPGESTWNNVTVNGKAATYSLTAAARHNGYQYRCKVTNAKGSVYSSAATLTVS